MRDTYLSVLNRAEESRTIHRSGISFSNQEDRREGSAASEIVSSLFPLPPFYRLSLPLQLGLISTRKRGIAIGADWHV